jgi:hypothetical protein
VAGVGMNGLGGWKGWDNSANEANHAIVNTTFAFSPLNSVMVSGTAGTSGNYTDLVHEFSGLTSGHYLFSAWQYIPTSSTVGTSYFILMDQYVDGNPGGVNLWAVQTTFNLATGIVHEDQSAGTDRTILRDQWVEIKYDIDLTANTITEYYNGQIFSATHAWQTPIHGIAAIDLYSDVSNPVYYDNIQIAVVPEPSTVALVALFGMIAAAWRRRNNAA